MNMLIEGKSQKPDYIYVSFIAIICFPFIVIFPLLDTDLQPNALVFCLLLFVYLISQKKISFDKSQLVLLFTMFGAIVVIPINDSIAEAIRSMSNYISISIISIISFYFFKKYGMNESIIKVCILIWFFVGAVQSFINPVFLTSLLRVARTSETRGVTSLSAEPSFYAVVLFFFLFFVKDFSKHKIFFFILIVLQVLFFAQAALGALLLFLFFAMYFLGDMSSKKQFLFFTIIVILGIIGYIFFDLIEALFWGNRIWSLLNRFFAGDILLDQSVYDRYYAIVDSILGMINNSFLPHGFRDRIMSGFGAVFYELGFMGFPLICVICMAIANCFDRKKIPIMILAFLFLLMAIQLAHPMLALIIGYGWYKRYLLRTGKFLTNDDKKQG